MLLLITLFYCSPAQKSDLATIKAKKGPFEITIPTFGEIQAVKSTPITVPPSLQGAQTIAWIAPENSIVKKGEKIIRLDSGWYTEKIEEVNNEIIKLELKSKK